MTQIINEFKGDFDFLSNFYYTPSPIWFDDAPYPTVENAYQAAKTLSVTERQPFRWNTPGQAKRAGKRLKIRDDWEQVKVEIMSRLVYQKFKPGTNLGLLLNLTDPYELIEGNTWGDTFWGVCKGEGQNVLGKILMGIRKKNRAYYEVNEEAIKQIESLGVF